MNVMSKREPESGEPGGGRTAPGSIASPPDRIRSQAVSLIEDFAVSQAVLPSWSCPRKVETSHARYFEALLFFCIGGARSQSKEISHLGAE